MISMGDISNACISVLGIIFFIKKLLRIVQILIPIFLIVMISIDFSKGVISLDSEKETILNHVLRRIMYTLALFLIPVTIFGLFKAFGLAANISDSEACWTYIGEDSFEEVKRLSEKQKEDLKNGRKNAINVATNGLNMRVKDKETVKTIITNKKNSTDSSNEKKNTTDDQKKDKPVKNKAPKAVIIVNISSDGDANRVSRVMEKYGFKVDIKTDADKLDPNDYDTLVIPGGHNIDPSVYGESRDPATYGTNKAKDLLQIKAVKKFKKAGKPILGICRGQQLVNVALGGTIIQDLPKSYNGWHKGDRKVTNKKGSFVEGLFGSKETVYHSHHQAIKKLGEGLKATSWDKDGTIESVEHESLPIYAVQWHPDISNSKHRKKLSKTFFEAYKKICQQYMK